MKTIDAPAMIVFSDIFLVMLSFGAFFFLFKRLKSLIAFLYKNPRSVIIIFV